MDADAADVKPVDVYARVSRLKRDEKRELSTEGQIAVCRARLNDLGLPVGKVLVDPGRSAWNPSVEREAWDELMHRLEAGVSGGMIVFDLERFSRQPKDGERMIELAVAGLLVLDSESEYDLTTPNGKKSFRDAINAAAYYSDRLSTRVRRGMRLKAIAGQPMGNHQRFGFELDRVTVREDQAEVIREATRRLLNGETRAAVISDFNDRGILTRDGHRWGEPALTRLLTREINCGRITSVDPKTGVKAVVGRLPGKPIVSEEDFDRVSAVVVSRRRGRPNSPHYLCSSFAICGRPSCGHTLHGRTRKDLRPYPDGSVTRSYWCNPSAGGCGKTEIDQQALDAAVPTLIIEILSDSRNAGEIEAAAREIASEATRLDSEITEAETVAEALAHRLGRGEITLTRYDVAVKPLDEQIARLKDKRDALPDPPPRPPPEAPQPTEASPEQWKHRWKDADNKGKRDLLKKALRGKHLVIAPAERGRGSADQADIARRVTIE